MIWWQVILIFISWGIVWCMASYSGYSAGWHARGELEDEKKADAAREPVTSKAAAAATTPDEADRVLSNSSATFTPRPGDPGWLPPTFRSEDTQ